MNSCIKKLKELEGNTYKCVRTPKKLNKEMDVIKKQAKQIFRIVIVKMLILPQTMYTFNEITLQIPMIFLTEKC